MGLRDWSKHAGMKQPVQATFAVTDSYMNRHLTNYLTGVLSGEGFAPFATEVKADINSNLPIAGQTLPALADAANPGHFKILWDDIPKVSWQQQARMSAQAAVAGQPETQPGTQTPAGLDVEALVREALSGLGPAVTTTTTVTVDGVPVGGDAGIPPILLGQGAGVAATAVVLSAHDVPKEQWPAGLQPPAGYLTFALDVTGPDGTTWPATTLQGFKSPQSRAEMGVVGATHPVRFDPASRSTVSFDLTAPKA